MNLNDNLNFNENMVNSKINESSNILKPVNIKEMYENKISKDININEIKNNKIISNDIENSEGSNKKLKKTNSLIMKKTKEKSINFDNLNSSMPDMNKINIENIRKQNNDEVV